MKYDYIIAIDPDTEKSGVATLNPATRTLETQSLTFPFLNDYLITIKCASEEKQLSVLIIVEAGWLHSKSDFRDVKGKAATRIAKNVGANHETGRKIIEMCKHFGLDVREQIPLKKHWKGKEGKITHCELAAFTRIEGRTNQEERDAALIAWEYAGLSFKIG